jgi:lactoylglutathione lyase
MYIEHVALFTRQLEVLRDFYVRYFGATAGARYQNPAKGFASYFLTFEAGGTGAGARLELMQKEEVPLVEGDPGSERTGLTHLAFRVGTPERVDRLTEELRADGYLVVGEPRTTGDGYYESVVLDPDSNRLELVA